MVRNHLFRINLEIYFLCNIKIGIVHEINRLALRQLIHKFFITVPSVIFQPTTFISRGNMCVYPH